jgi:hypothetical protein
MRQIRGQDGKHPLEGAQNGEPQPNKDFKQPVAVDILNQDLPCSKCISGVKSELRFQNRALLAPGD